MFFVVVPFTAEFIHLFSWAPQNPIEPEKNNQDHLRCHHYSGAKSASGVSFSYFGVAEGVQSKEVGLFEIR